MIEKGKNLYYMAVIPDGDLLKELVQLKKEFSGKFNARHALKSPPHITLHMPFKWREDRENALIGHLSGAIFSPFEIRLTKFEAFAPRVIYIGVERSKGLSEMYEQVKLIARSKLKIDNSSYRDQGFHPHLTIAHRDLKRVDFERAWEEYRDRPVNKGMSVGSFWLLKHDGKKWEPFREYPCIKN